MNFRSKFQILEQLFNNWISVRVRTCSAFNFGSVGEHLSNYKGAIRIPYSGGLGRMMWCPTESLPRWSPAEKSSPAEKIESIMPRNTWKAVIIKGYATIICSIKNMPMTSSRDRDWNVTNCHQWNTHVSTIGWGQMELRDPEIINRLFTFSISNLGLTFAHSKCRTMSQPFLTSRRHVIEKVKIKTYIPFHSDSFRVPNKLKDTFLKSILSHFDHF